MSGTIEVTFDGQNPDTQAGAALEAAGDMQNVAGIPAGTQLAAGSTVQAIGSGGQTVGVIMTPPSVTIMPGTVLSKALLQQLGATISDSGYISGNGIMGQIRGYDTMSATTKAGLTVTSYSEPVLTDDVSTNPDDGGESEGAGGHC